jgi:hypothetical protein
MFCSKAKYCDLDFDTYGVISKARRVLKSLPEIRFHFYDDCFNNYQILENEMKIS